ncbi:hypothetical protein GQ457_10G005160 [Hibiscus cannabinus]
MAQLAIVACLSLAFKVEENQLPLLLEFHHDKLDEFYRLIMELARTRVEGNPLNKRRFNSIPRSPNGVMDLLFNSDKSNDSWVVSSSTMSSSPEHVYKKFKTRQEQILDRLGHASPDFLSIPH